MRFPTGNRLRSSLLQIEQLEDRTVPSALRVAPPFALPTRLSAIPEQVASSERLTVVTTSTNETQADLRSLGATPFASSVKHLGFGIYLVNLQSGSRVNHAVSYYSKLPNVVSAEPDRLIVSSAVPNDPSYGSLWAMPKMSAPAAWDIATGSSSITVAVIDTGVDYNHPDLAANIWTNPGEIPNNGIDDDGNGYIDDVRGWDFANRDNNPMDDNGHGTHCAGTIGAIGNNGIGVTGINWNVKIMPLKFMSANGTGFTSDAVAALNYAVNMGARISNNSWGGGGGTALSLAISRARDRGHIFVAAAGNNNTNIDSSPYYPASFSMLYDNVVTVAASDSSDRRASFSNFGFNTVALAAPGVSILSTTPGNQYAYYSGTSMAAPHVAGALALFWSQHPDWSYLDVINKLKTSVDPVSTLATVSQSGGRLNLAKYLASSGIAITSSVFSGSTNNTLDKLRVTFNRPIDPSSFTAADIVSLTGPNGSAINTEFTITAVAGSNHTQFDIFFTPQSASGNYSMVIGPDIRDAFGYQMNQDGDVTNGEPTEDRYTAIGSLFGAGPVVISSSFSGSTQFQFDKVRFTFDRPIDASTFSPADIVSFTRDGNAVNTTFTITAVPGSKQTQFDVQFSPQATPGIYQMVIGPDICDTTGTPMNQDADEIDGEPIQDCYSVTERLIKSGPKVIHSAFSGNTQSSFERVRFTFDRPIDPNTFSAEDIISLTRNGNPIITNFNIVVVNGTNNTQFDVGFVTQNVAGQYQMIIGPNIRDEFGTPMNQDGDNTNGEVPDDIAIATATLTTSGPRISDAAFVGSSMLNFNKVRLTFDRPIIPSTFTAADISSFTRDGATISTTYTITPVAGTNNTQFEVTFASQTRAGLYRMVVGPNISDTNGLLMNQDADGLNGEIPDDRFVATARLVLPQVLTTPSRDGMLPINDLRTTTSTINVTQSLRITDLNVLVTLNHTAVGNLKIVLKAPDGTSITLFDQRGGNGANLRSTVFDDQAANSISSFSARAPFTGSFKPEQTLSALNGKNTFGTWTLEVTDTVPQNTGSLRAWSITFAGIADSGSQALGLLGIPDNSTMSPSTTALNASLANRGIDPRMASTKRIRKIPQILNNHNSHPMIYLKRNSPENKFVSLTELGFQASGSNLFELLGSNITPSAIS